MPDQNILICLIMLLGLTLATVISWSKRAGTNHGHSAKHKHLGSKWIDDNFDELEEGQWVAANFNGLVAKDKTLGGLMKKLRSKRVSLLAVAIRYKEIAEERED